MVRREWWLTEYHVIFIFESYFSYTLRCAHSLSLDFVNGSICVLRWIEWRHYYCSAEIVYLLICTLIHVPASVITPFLFFIEDTGRSPNPGVGGNLETSEVCGTWSRCLLFSSWRSRLPAQLISGCRVGERYSVGRGIIGDNWRRNQ